MLLSHVISPFCREVTCELIIKIYRPTPVRRTLLNVLIKKVPGNGL